MKNKTGIFALLGSLIITLFMFTINITTSFAHPWFIYPTFAIMWWPMAIFFSETKNSKMFSIVGTIWIALFFITINLVTSPTYLWFIYPVFAVLWWPVSLVLCSEKKYKLYSVVASLMTVAFFMLVNYTSSPGVMWFFYPAFVIVWWPLSMFFAKKKWIKLYSVIMSLTIIGFLALTNMINSPDTIWFQYTIFYILIWPIVVLLGEKAKTTVFAIVASLVIIGYHVLLYYTQTPGAYPWFLQMIMPLAWWPVSIAFKEKTKTKTFLFVSVAVFLSYYITLNMILTPSLLWVPYLVYAALWVLMGIYFGTRKKFFALSLCATVVTIVFFTVVNVITTPDAIWAVYPSFAIVWWPLSMYFFKVKKEKVNR